MKLVYFNFAAVLVLIVMLTALLIHRAKSYGNKSFFFATFDQPLSR